MFSRWHDQAILPALLLARTMANDECAPAHASRCLTGGGLLVL